MKLGACCGITAFEKQDILQDNGFDYFEANFGDVVSLEDAEVDEVIAHITKRGFSCEACNCFFPKSIPLTGNDVDYDMVTEYLEKGMERAQRIGIKSVVFGSSGARNFPEGFTFTEAYKQLIVFLRDYAGPIAAKYGVNIAIEPLTVGETNIIFTVRDGVALAVASGAPNVKGLGDNYHMCNNGDSEEDIRNMPGMVIHSHVSNGKTRKYPRRDDGFDYKPFFDALKFASCERCSIEGRADDFPNDVPEAYAVLSQYK